MQLKKVVIGLIAVAGATLVNPDLALACRGIVGDYVWVDVNGNGLQEAGEPGINGVTLRIVPSIVTQNDFPRSSVTSNGGPLNQPGWYQFDNVTCAKDWTISVDATTVPAGYNATAINVGSDNALDSNDPNGTVVNLFNDGINNPPPDLTIDFGYVPPCTGTIGDLIWNDLNRNGQQDPGEPGLPTSVQLGSNPPASSTNGAYQFGGLCGGTYFVCVAVPAGYDASPANQGVDISDSDGVSDGAGKSCATVMLTSNETNLTIDFGFNQPPVSSPGTGTPGYWKNHLDAWPVNSLAIGGLVYTQAEILPYMTEDPKDKTTTIFRALVAAKLNVLIGNNDSCVASTISAADGWLAANGPVGAGIKASSPAWRQGEPLYRLLDNYNNGMLCAAARD